MLEKYSISVAGSSKSTNWKRKTYTWDALAGELSKPKMIGSETMREFDRLAKSEKAIRKDVGGFVGGTLAGGRRSKNSVTGRSLITLDVDYGEDDFFFDFTMKFSCAAVIYGTRSDRPGKRRFRLIIPMDREIDNREEYEAASRKVAEIMGIELFDPTTFQAERLMYWGSVSKDQEFYFERQDGEALNVDELLDMYGDDDAWKDVRLWAFTDNEELTIRSSVSEAGEPTSKPGMIGAFCQVYTVQEAIEKYLSDVYEECSCDRYTYKGGSSAAGMIVYDDKFAYSHHSTDPIGDGHVYNAYDLVRIHLFGHLGKEESEHAMAKLVQEDESCLRELVAAKDCLDDFDDVSDESVEETEEVLDWDLDSKGRKEVTIRNFVNAFRTDPLLNNLLAYDQFRGVIVYTRKPFFDSSKDKGDIFDDTAESIIRNRIETAHRIYSTGKMCDAIEYVANKNGFHPIKTYLDSLVWDGKPRVDMFLQTYMGAEDSIYTREAFRKMLVAAVARIYEPGTKFDTALIMVSHQGAGKSTLVQRLSKGWFNDSMTSMEGTKAYESIQNAWLVELAELSAVKKSDIEVMKNFLSKREDTYRAAYAKRIKTHKRQCVFFGSTNEDEFLKDQTGNRRFFPVAVKWNSNSHYLFEKSFEDTIDQLWAEAKELYDAGESLILSKTAESIANGIREEYTEVSSMHGLIERFVNLKFPKDWDDWVYADRRDFVDGLGVFEEGTEVRKEFCAFEVWCDGLGLPRKDFTTSKAREVAGSLKRLGFVRNGQRNVNIYGRQSIYTRIISETEE